MLRRVFKQTFTMTTLFFVLLKRIHCKSWGRGAGCQKFDFSFKILHKTMLFSCKVLQESSFPLHANRSSSFLCSLHVPQQLLLVRVAATTVKTLFDILQLFFLSSVS